MSSREQCTHVGFINAPFGGEVMPKFEVAKNANEGIVVFALDHFDDTPTDMVVAEFTVVDHTVKGDIYSSAVGPEVVTIAGDLATLEMSDPTDLELHAASKERGLGEHVKSVAANLGSRALFRGVQIA